MKPHTVIQICPSLSLRGGTAGKIKALAEQSRYRQIFCYPDTPQDESLKAQWKDIPHAVFAPGFKPRNPIANARLLARLVRQYDARIIHAYFPIDSISAALTKLMCPSVRIVRSFEGPIHYAPWKRRIQQLAFAQHDRFVAISRYIHTYILEQFPQLQREPFDVIYNGPAFFEPLGEPIRHQASAHVLVSVGAMNPTKNTETMIEAVKILKDRGIKVKYRVVGDGPLRPKVEGMIQELGIADEVELCGYQSNVRPFLDECSIYVHPANLEGFGMAVVEAMSRCCAIIVSDSCALPELIDNGTDGLIAKTYDARDWADKIERLLNDQSAIDTFGQRAYQKAATTFSIQAYAKNLDNLYDHLYENH